MFEREIERYNTLLKEYRATVIDRFNVEDLKEYNEILFSAHSCAIEGNTFSVDDTRALKEKGLPVDPSDTTVEEARADILHALKEMNSPLLKGGALND